VKKINHDTTQLQKMSVSINHSVYFGFQNEKGLEVSAELKARGLDYLRASPSQLNLFALRDFVQIGYDVYKGLLPAYMTSMYTQISSQPSNTRIRFHIPSQTRLPVQDSTSTHKLRTPDR
jgi:hypothetical protein